MKPTDAIRIITRCEAVTIAAGVWGLSDAEKRAFENRIIARAEPAIGVPGVSPQRLDAAIYAEIAATRKARADERRRTEQR